MTLLFQQKEPFPTFDGMNYTEWKTKLFALLASPKWHNIHLQTQESPPYTLLSAKLYKKLKQGLFGEALLPYSSNLPQGIHLLQHILETNESSSSSALITLFLKWSTRNQLTNSPPMFAT